MTFARDDVDLFGRHIRVARELGKRFEMFNEHVMHGVSRRHHCGPHIGADGVVGAQNIIGSLFRNNLALAVETHPVGCVSARSGTHERAHRAFDDRIPVLILHRKAAHDEDRIVGRVERDEVFLLKALVARKQNLAQPLDVAHVLLKKVHHGLALGRIVGTIP